MATRIHNRWARVASGVVLGVAASCTVTTEDNENHCGNQDGNTFCAEKYPGGARPFCGFGIPGCEVEQLDGCVSVRPADDACYSPCGDGKVLPDDPDCEGVAEGSSSSATVSETDATSEPTGSTMTMGTGSMSTSDSETESESSSTTTVSGCTLSSECTDAANPICVEMECVPCSADAECLDRDPGLPACRDDGQCVACTASNASACADTTPVCNPAVNECEGCAFHEQCPESACRIATGGCFDAEAVHDVGQGMEFDSIGEAVAMLGEGGEVVLRIFAGADYNEAVTIGGGGTAYALLADDDDAVPQWIYSMGGASTLRVQGGAEVYVQSLRFTLNGAGGFPGITANASSLYLDRSQVVGNTGGGITLTTGADGHLRNCIVGANGANNFSPTTGIRVADSTIDVVYTTLALNQGDAEDSMQCTNAGGTFRNSIALGSDTMSYACAGVTTTNSAFDGPVAGNTNVGALQPSWFDNVASSVFTLTAAGGTAFGDIAQWAVGDPLVDIDGDARPTEPGPDVAGADIP